ncbi:Ku protein [Corynebacterium aquatimens]|uniref:Non-homologous end joining protein Ku n=1 Tax=Corynebacterium aquatimens TaxID=1190508 RepID=A0A931E0R5_9CORY|nr:Ku protein [Corynebacterium aquatimens]MBG6121256.1 DNA end-binding protein Ku [Corynebacterium aquatimens]WJY66193.1 putative DNA repair protein YkoV [Corynebacterium aquatimens]
MRAIWSGAITFGLVNVPVKAYGATTNHDISFHQVHAKDNGRIHYERRCEVCGEIVEYADIAKAFEEDGDTVVLSDDDFDSLPEADNDEIEVLQFVPSDQVDPVMLDKSYYLEPQGKTPKSYLLLRQTLEDTDRTAIVRFALRQKTRLGALRVRGKVLILQSMLWADEIRDIDYSEGFKGTKSRAKIGDKELKLSAALVEQYSSDFTPEEYEDDYQVELRKLIDAKFEHGDTIDTEATFGRSGSGSESGSDFGSSSDSDSSGDSDADVVDLMAALQASLEKKRGKSA